MRGAGREGGGAGEDMYVGSMRVAGLGSGCKRVKLGKSLSVILYGLGGWGPGLGRVAGSA